MRPYSIVLIIVVIAALAYYSYPEYNKAIEQARPWVNPLVTPEEVAAVEFVKQNTVEREIFVTDIFAGELLMSRALREGTEGGDWAIVADVASKMGEIDRLYDTQSAEEASRIAKKFNATHVWVPNRQLFAGFSWKRPVEEKFGDPKFFELVFENQTKIYKVK